MKPIQVTEPYLPPFEEYVEYLKGIWGRNWLTNQGPLTKELEQKLQDYHQLEMPVHLVANGALGLQIALKALGVKGEVVTTPFSYVATTSCPLWEGCSVKFADIEPDTLTIDPKAVEAAITPQTEAILATHVFGNPCDVEALDAIGSKHGLAVIYDAAHAFGVTYKGKSILEYGDASMVSLHATKLMHSVEGGFIVARDSAVSEKMEWMRRFGHKGPEEFHGIGTNAKMSEFHAAMGLCNLNHIEEILEKRRLVVESYKQALTGLEESVRFAFSIREATKWNASYFPVLFNSESDLLVTSEKLMAENVHARRYFYPSLDGLFDFQLSGAVQVSTDVSKRILCLPLMLGLSEDFAQQVVSLLH
jgi:dTDP-4-amino-4,6-dideoxygalactose transaminase